MRKVLMLAFFCIMLALVATGCSKKYSALQTSQTPSEQGAQKEMVTEEPAQMAKLEREEVTGEYVEDVSIAFDDIYFDFDKFEIKEASKPTLDKLASWLMNNNAKVIVEGHCDERGTNEYNLGLGDRRANSTTDYLVASGVSPDRIQMISYGEERPQCTEKKESCWSLNRRAHFVILTPAK